MAPESPGNAAYDRRSDNTQPEAKLLEYYEREDAPEDEICVKENGKFEIISGNAACNQRQKHQDVRPLKLQSPVFFCVSHGFLSDLSESIISSDQGRTVWSES